MNVWLRGAQGCVGLCLIVAVVVAPGCRPAAIPHVPRWSDWAKWGYRASRRKPQGSFNVAFRVQGAPVGRTRVAFCVQDEKNYYFLELNPHACYLGRSERGVERALAGLGLGVQYLVGKEVVVERRALRIGVVVDGRALREVDDELFHDGGVAFGGVKSRLRLEAAKVQPIGDIYFADDFMRAQTERGQWRTVTGKWETKVLRNPALSINAFSYVGTGSPGTAVTGRPFWSDVDFSASCRPRGSSVVGLYVAYRDPSNYYLMRWYSRRAKRPVRQLVRCRYGIEKVLAESEGGHLGDQWYQISVGYGGGWADVRIDDTPVLRAADEGLTMGRVGIYVESETGVEFDDVLVRSRTSFADDFDREGRGRWAPHGGSWRYLAEGAPWFGQRTGRRMLV